MSLKKKRHIADDCKMASHSSNRKRKLKENINTNNTDTSKRRKMCSINSKKGSNKIENKCNDHKKCRYKKAGGCPTLAGGFATKSGKEST